MTKSAGSRRRARRNQNAARSTAPRAAALLQQQRRDQEPGDDEEDLDPDPPALHPREAGVVQDHRDHRQRPQPVEAGLVAEARLPAPAEALDLDRPGRVMVPDDGVAPGRVAAAGPGLRGGVDVELAEPAQRRRVGRRSVDVLDAAAEGAERPACRTGRSPLNDGSGSRSQAMLPISV